MRSTYTVAGALAQVDAYPLPKGVSAERWAALTTELKRLIVARREDRKTLFVTPTGAANTVTDLAAVSDAGGTQATLTWTEVLVGDCNNDGQVSIADLVPIAAHYGETSTGPGSPAYLPDANGDGHVDIADLQPIAADYSMHLQGYQVWRGHWNGTSTDWDATLRPNTNPANLDWSADRPSPPPANARPSYTYTDDISGVADRNNIRYKVTAFGDGAPGAESNEATMPPPMYFTISGTVSLVPSALSPPTLVLWPFGATVRTQSDGTYTFSGVQDGTYTVTPYQPTYVLSPDSRTVTVAGGDVSAQDFSGIKGTGLAATAWPKFHADARNTGRSPYIATQAGALKWSAALGSPLLSPVLGNANTVYLGLRGFTAGNLVAVGGEDGTLRWGGDAGALPASWMTPAVGSDGVLYLLSSASFRSVNPLDGSTRWERMSPSPQGSPAGIANDGTVYVTGYSGIQAFEPVAGTLLWQVTLGGDSYSCPAIAADGTIYVGCMDSKVYALSPSDGSVKWTYSAGGPIGTSIAIADDGTLYAASEDGKLYALNPDGSLKWASPVGGPLNSSPAVGSDGTIYVGSDDNRVYAVNPDGTAKWSYPTAHWVQSSPAVGADGTVYVGSYDGRFYALNGADGTLKWSYQTGDSIMASPAIGADGTVYIGSYDGNLYAFGP